MVYLLYEYNILNNHHKNSSNNATLSRNTHKEKQSMYTTLSSQPSQFTCLLIKTPSSVTRSLNDITYQIPQ